MRKILLVDDDAVIVEIYRMELLDQGFQVDVAQDGLAAMRALPQSRPDLVVLDMMMPKFSGAEVLKYIRSRPDMQATRVVVLSNFYSNDPEQTAAIAMADKAILKSNCTPALLLEVVNELFSGPARETAESPGAPAPPAAPALPPVAPAPPLVRPAPAPVEEFESEFQTKTRADFLKNGPATLAAMRHLFEDFVQSDSAQARTVRLLDFYRKTHFVTAMASAAGCGQIALLASAFEALLLELYEKPQYLGPSTLQTIAYTLDFICLLLAHAEDHVTDTWKKSPKALLVEDDPLSSRAMTIALRRANLTTTAVADALAALEKLTEDQYDLILLDVQIPGMDGFELCKTLRAQPRYRRTPVIFITGHADFQSRMHGVLSGGNDLIAKPIFPIELAVKAVTHLLRSQLPEEWALG